MKTIVVPRQISMYLAREMTDNSLPKLVPGIWRQRSYNGDSCARKDSAIIGKDPAIQKKSVKLKFIELLGCGKLNKRTKLSTTYAQVDNLVKSMLF